MSNPSRKNTLSYITLIITAVFSLFVFTPLFAIETFVTYDKRVEDDKRAVKSVDKTTDKPAEKAVEKPAEKTAAPVTKKIKPPVKEDESKLNEFQKQAREYRAEGLKEQKMGDIDSALKYYQKSVELDPAYAASLNDLGIIYEAKEDVGRAEQCYLAAIKADPAFISPYSNLALLYENKRDLNNAAFYWGKRAEMGALDDPWTKKAKARYDDIRLTLGEIPVDAREQEVVSLVKDVSVQKSLMKKDNKEMARLQFKKAKELYQKGFDAPAIREAINALQLDPDNDSIKGFIEKLQTRILSK